MTVIVDNNMAAACGTAMSCAGHAPTLLYSTKCEFKLSLETLDMSSNC